MLTCVQALIVLYLGGGGIQPSPPPLIRVEVLLNYDACTTQCLHPRVWVEPRSDLAEEISRLPQKFQNAVLKLMRVLHASRQDDGQFRYCEVSVGFISNHSEFGFETARKAWHWLKSRIGFLSVHIDVIRSMDLKIRDRKTNGRWGQHILMHELCIRRLSSACGALGIRNRCQDREWEQVKPLALRGRVMTKCPFHNDQDPSMVLNGHDTKSSGSAYCFGCQRSAFWVKESGRTKVSLSLNTPVGSSLFKKWWNIEPDIHSELKENEPLTINPVRTNQTILFKVGSKGGRKRIIKKDLVDSLRVMDRTSKRESSWSAAVTQLKESGEIEDRYLTVDSMIPKNYRKVRTKSGDRYIPDQWKPELSRYLLVDLDGFSQSPIGNVKSGLGSAMDNVAKNSPMLNNGCIVIQTSSYGLQILFELSSPEQVRSNWMKRESLEIDRIDNAALMAARGCGFSGGSPDKSAHSCGRNMRAPAYRVDKKGILCRSRIVHDSIK